MVIDTLRADHLGCYGYPRATSPALDALAARGVRFARAHAPSSWTLPSVVSIMTGLDPAAHGVERNTSVLAEGRPTMAEAFRAAGYETMALSAHPALVTPLQGLARGFDRFTVLHGPVANRRARANIVPADPWLQSSVTVAPAGEMSETALAWLSEPERTGAPFMLYVHYFDPHAPYFPPPEYARRFGVVPDAPLTGAEQWPLLLAPQAPESADDLATLTALYDAEIASTDAAIARLLDGLRARAGRPTLVLVTSDHGEEFGEHGELQHGRALWQELLHVPLIVAGPGILRGRVVDEPVSLVSLWATLADLAGLADPATSAAPSFANLMRGEPDPAPRRIFADLEPRFARDRHVHRRAIIDGAWKLTVAPDRRVSLFNLDSDPAERDDLQRSEQSRAGFLRMLLRVRDVAAQQASAEAPPTTISFTPEMRALLRALGYLK